MHAIPFVAVWLTGYAFSLYMSELYYAGDQRYYSAFWDSAGTAPLSAIPYLQALFTGSGEPLYGLVVWIGSRLMEKAEWMSIFNATLLCCIYVYLRTQKVYIFVFPLLFLNYYVLGMMFAAERLKFAFLMLLAFFLFRSRARVLALVAAPLFHFQAVIFLSGYLAVPAKRLLHSIVRGRMRPAEMLALLLAASFLVALAVLFHTFLAGKLAAYRGDGLEDIVKSSVFFLSALVFARDRLMVCLMFIPILFLAYMLGDDRMNIVAFFLAMHVLLPLNRGLHPVPLTFLVYFLWKGVGFISDVSEHGTAYL